MAMVSEHDGSGGCAGCAHPYDDGIRAKIPAGRRWAPRLYARANDRERRRVEARAHHLSLDVRALAPLSEPDALCARSPHPAHQGVRPRGGETRGETGEDMILEPCSVVVDRIVDLALEEDLGSGDLTTEACVDAD